ncbi:alpha/beta hydrolase-fold protein [Microbacterium sp. 1P10UB]|uniref:alpha/beta hydrolase-fold protein n=1 Tax=unclassified Microbacterium TaxID=2609290 RepID=UPI0039A37C74
MTAAAVGVGSLLAAPPAMAVDDDSWVSVPQDAYYRFSVPNAAVVTAVGSEAAMAAAEGSFGPGKTTAQLNMSRSGDNWTGTIGPLEPGLYSYRYKATVGGSEALVSFRNPGSPQEVTSDGSLKTIFVSGAESAWMADVPAGGALQTISYDSSTAGAERSALVWTPPSYDADRAEPYPVLYLLGDAGQSYREWAELGRVGQILDNLIVEGEAEPMVVVMGDGDTSEARAEVLDNIVPAAREDFNISDEPADQAIAGIGRGGSQALNLLLTDTGEFSKVGSFSGSLVSSVGSAKAAQINDATDLIRLYVGNATDKSYNQNVSLVQKLSAAGVEYEFDGVTAETGGTWNTWRENLRDFASRLFRTVDDHGPSAGNLELNGPTSLPAPGTTPTPFIDENGIVTFETGTEYADAKNVTVWGNFAPGGSWLRVPMEKAGDRWRVTVGPMDAAFYYYKFIVDRVDKKDTGNPGAFTTEVNWSPFLIPGDTAPARFLSDVPEGEGGALNVLDYQSQVAAQQRSAYVWTPPGYDPERAEAYPVFILNHGGGQSWTDWVQSGRAKQILDNHYRDGNLTPMVVIMPNGNVSDFNKEIRENLMPAAEAAYHLSTDPSQRAMAGLSAGGARTVGMLKAYPGDYSYIGVFSAGFGGTTGIDVAAINAGTKVLRLYVGDITDFVNPGALTSVQQMEAAGIEFEFDGITVGPHGWDPWQKNLIDFAPRLFKADTSSGIPVEATIPEAENGVLALTVADFGDGVAVSAPENAGDRLRMTGALPEVTVTDSRTAQQAGLGGWAVSGQADAFTSDGQTVEAEHFGWIPQVLTPRPGLSAGDPVLTVMDAGPGLATPGELASADREGRFGTAKLGAELRLEVPVDTQPGTYTGQVTISLFPVD